MSLSYKNNQLSQTGFPSFSSLRGLAGPALILLYSSIAFSLLTMTLQLYHVSLINTENFTDASDFNQIAMIEAILYYIGFIYQFIVIIRIGVIFGWFSKAYQNLFALGASNLSSSPRMAKISFFIPLYNIYKPYVIFQEIWKASNPNTVLSRGDEWQKNRSSNLVKIGWITGILFVIISATGYFYYQSLISIPNNASSMDPFLNLRNVLVVSTTILILANAVFLICAICYVKIIKQVTSWQDSKNIERNSPINQDSDDKNENS